MSAQIQSSPQSEAAANAANERCQGKLVLPDPFTLECGETLGNAHLAWQCVGPAEAPLVLVLGGISAHRRSCAADACGWWESQCGNGRALNSDRYRLLGVDWLGGCGDSTGPGDSGGGFPAISTSDQARALLLLLNRLGVRRVHSIVGASYGGAVAQHLAALLGERLRNLVVLSAAHRSGKFALALRHVQRAILDLGADSAAALGLARSLAVLGYRTSNGFEQRFAEPDGDVVGWLAHHGEHFAARFNAAAYRCLGESLDAHHIDPVAIRVPTTLFTVREDLNVPVALMREFAAGVGARCALVEVSSIYGHDAFLKEDETVAQLLRGALEDVA